MGINAAENYILDNPGPDAKCPGDEFLDDCPTVSRILNNANHFTRDAHLTATDELIIFNKLELYTLGCVACRHVCQISLEMAGRYPTGNKRLEFTPPPAK